jgi:hypothetical protein
MTVPPPVQAVAAGTSPSTGVAEHSGEDGVDVPEVVAEVEQPGERGLVEMA